MFRKTGLAITASLLTLVVAQGAAAAEISAGKLKSLKADAVAGVESRAKLAQVMNDKIFSFGELGFQEVETSAYITKVLEENGFTIQRGVSGIPTAWTATWTHGQGGPTIALGSDIDCIPKASQKPGVPWHDPIIPGAPGHGEGHNSGQAVNVVAALAVKDLMVKQNIAGTLVLWPGVAEELVAGKAYMVRDGVFKGVDATIFTHVGANLQTTWGQPSGTGLVSVKYSFHGESAHSAGAPWRGRSALDAVELMNIGWNMRREHLRPEQRSHHVISDGGDQPNVVPSEATVWYYFREQTFDAIKKSWAIGDKIAKAAADMTDTKVSSAIVGTAAPRHFNRPMAEAAQKNIEQVGLPKWTEDEQAFAKAVQKNVGSTKQEGLDVKLKGLKPPEEKPESGGSDDIGDISWIMPTITINYPSNIPDLPGHHWANAISMATPIAHKGVVAGSKVVAMTTLDLLTQPKLLADSKAYFTNVQTKDQKYVPMLSAADKPQTQMNANIMATYRPEMKAFYYDPDKYGTYLEQLGIAWPVKTLTPPAAAK
ncbi:M20 family metallopeptidase [Caulobacter vibrioides]|nr:M20 family metallopeptidase [Caulobacter vibrioides]YP_002516998.1 aminobenzoyl-glutamate utilization protein B [Caulobacter vibrioides NA1000]ACL95090.1 aminobenzoyl-glutamate utilization protein B [Caulobacter vibrioides NA1000]QXZ53624.1 amidohydrolase [Caulobacter vibrioides]